jgi:hypothetical protein
MNLDTDLNIDLLREICYETALTVLAEQEKPLEEDASTERVAKLMADFAVLTLLLITDRIKGD